MLNKILLLIFLLSGRLIGLCRVKRCTFFSGTLNERDFHEKGKRSQRR